MKKSQALASALQQQGRTAAAVTHLGSSIGLLASLGIASQSARPLIQSLVMTRAKLPDDHDEGNHGNAEMKPADKIGSRCGRRHCLKSIDAQQCCTVACCCSINELT